jgi:hypothetical protein
MSQSSSSSSVFRVVRAKRPALAFSIHPSHPGKPPRSSTEMKDEWEGDWEITLNRYGSADSYRGYGSFTVASLPFHFTPLERGEQHAEQRHCQTTFLIACRPVSHELGKGFTILPHSRRAVVLLRPRGRVRSSRFCRLFPSGPPVRYPCPPWLFLPARTRLNCRDSA